MEKFNFDTSELERPEKPGGLVNKPKPTKVQTSLKYLISVYNIKGEYFTVPATSIERDDAKHTVIFKGEVLVNMNWIAVELGLLTSEGEEIGRHRLDRDPIVVSPGDKLNLEFRLTRNDYFTL